MAGSSSGKWEQIRARKLADPASRERYERTRRSVGLTRELLHAIDARREEVGLTKAALAQRVGVPPSAVRRMLTSRASNPTLTTVAELLEVLGLELIVRPKKTGRRSGERERASPAADAVAGAVS